MEVSEDWGPWVQGTFYITFRDWEGGSREITCWVLSLWLSLPEFHSPIGLPASNISSPAIKFLWPHIPLPPWQFLNLSKCKYQFCPFLYVCCWSHLTTLNYGTKWKCPNIVGFWMWGNPFFNTLVVDLNIVSSLDLHSHLQRIDEHPMWTPNVFLPHQSLCF